MTQIEEDILVNYFVKHNDEWNEFRLRTDKEVCSVLQEERFQKKLDESRRQAKAAAGKKNN
jgi:hypothetical protein